MTEYFDSKGDRIRVGDVIVFNDAPRTKYTVTHIFDTQLRVEWEAILFEGPYKGHLLKSQTKSYTIVKRQYSRDTEWMGIWES